MRARIVVLKSDQSPAVGFPDFLEDNWQTNGCVYFELTVLRFSSGAITTCPFFPTKTGDHLLGSALSASNFCWI